MANETLAAFCDLLSVERSGLTAPLYILTAAIDRIILVPYNTGSFEAS